MKTVFLDCDQTLYQNPELIGAIRERMVLYMVEKLGRPLEEMTQLRQQYLRAYGTTLAGLMKHQNIDPYEYMEFVHRVDTCDYLKRDDTLRELLTNLGVKVNILSNAPRDHVMKVLSMLGLEGIFDRIFTIEDFNFLGKPNRRCFEKVCTEMSLEPSDCWLFDDDPQNLEGARDFGFKTCLVGQEPCDGFDLHISELKEISRYIKKITGSDE